MRRAVIDVGSNSVLLVVAENCGGRWEPLHETSKVTGLGEGTKSTGLLSARGMDATLLALDEAFARAREAGADQITAAATMAARIATNTEEFLLRAEEQGTPVTVLSGEDEAELGFLAVAGDPRFAGHSRISIVDVGGQSTEIVTADRGETWRVRYRRSYPIGTLALRSTILKAEKPEPASILSASAEIDDLLGIGYRPGQCGHVAALGATATNLVTLRERITVWEPDRVHGVYLQYEEIGRAVGWLCGMTDAERAALPGLEVGREGTIHIGALILERCLFALRAEGCSVSVRGWRHALLERLN